MKRTKKFTAAVALMLVCIFALSACSSFYDLFAEGGGEDGVYIAIYDATNTDEEIAAIPDVKLIAAGDLLSCLKTYGLSYEITVAFDTETKTDAALTCYYYHNRNDESASDYCRIGMSYQGTYKMEGDKITFKIESESYNMAFYTVGSDYAGLEDFQKFSYGEDKSNGVWAYENATWDYENTAVIDASILEGVPSTIVFTVSGNKIVTWEAAE